MAFKTREQALAYYKKYNAENRDARNVARKKWNDENKEYRLQKQKEYAQANAEKLKQYYSEYNASRPNSAEYHKAYYEANKARIAERKKAYREENKERLAEAKKVDYELNKEARLAQKKEYRKKAAGNIAYLNASRKKAVRQRTPKWLTKDDRLTMKCVYAIAAMLTRHNGEPWHVDHSIPLQGKHVSGLHVPLNLRVMRGVENISKKNKFEVTHV
jgi:hypothetical protein